MTNTATSEQTTDYSEGVQQAIAELEECFTVTAVATGDGGAVLTVQDLPIDPRWEPYLIDLTFEVAYNYPSAAIYPYYTTPALRRVDGGAWPQGLQKVAWRGADRTQVSLRANRWNPTVDTALGAVLQVQRWFETI